MGGRISRLIFLILLLAFIISISDMQVHANLLWTVKEMNKTYGQPIQTKKLNDGTSQMVWRHNLSKDRFVLLAGLVTKDMIWIEDILLPEKVYGDKAFLFWIGQYNDNHVKNPRLKPHEFADGGSAIQFDGGYWALPYKDKDGGIFAIKIWKE